MKQRWRKSYFTTLMIVSLLCVVALAYALSFRFRIWVLYGVNEGRFTRVQDTKGLGERVELSEAPSIVGDWFPGQDGRLLMVLAHGSTPMGRRDGLIQLLAWGLQLRGFSVLAIDLSGFGESADPPMPFSDDFRFDAAVLRAVDEIVQRGWAKPEAIAYVGHSLGAGVVLRAARAHPKPFAIIAIGGPCTKSRFAQSGRHYRRQFALDRFRDMAIDPDSTSIEIMAQYLEGMDPATQLSFNDLPPVLFIYGEKERAPSSCLAAALRGLRSKRRRINIVAGAPHSYHVKTVRQTVRLYNHRMLDEILNSIESWTAIHRPQR